MSDLDDQLRKTFASLRKQRDENGPYTSATLERQERFLADMEAALLPNG